ncbi:MAG: bifunctional riboflavin kinase/FAD synthetase [Clostridia bacterium]|nr:bifunctional riboflavin kinase/FAD synthetase [Clostridia bacterium]
MEIYHNLEEVDLKGTKLLVALGNFDGVHLGHRQLLGQLVATAREQGVKAAVLTFDPHPLQVINPEISPPLLLNPAEKARQIASLGVDMLILVPFTIEFAGLPPEEFVANILVDRLKVNGIFVGWNYNFGRGGRGNTELLAALGDQYGFFVRVVKPVSYQGQVVSSTLIRELLQQGEVSKATVFLGYRPYFSGLVVHGDARGRTIGFPTANLELAPNLVKPAKGVYAVYFLLGNRILKGVANIGVKPTFHQQGQTPNLEVFIFDFAGDIYGEEVRVELVARIRDEKTFSSVDELISQLREDVEQAQIILAAENDDIW